MTTQPTATLDIDALMRLGREPAPSGGEPTPLNVDLSDFTRDAPELHRLAVEAGLASPSTSELRATTNGAERLLQASVLKTTLEDPLFSEAPDDAAKLKRANEIRRTFDLSPFDELPEEFASVGGFEELGRQFGTARGLAAKLPVIGDIGVAVFDSATIFAAADRIEKGAHTEDDLNTMAAAVERSISHLQERTLGGKFVRILSQIPTFGAEFALTLGAGPVARKVITASVAKIASETAAKVVERILLKRGIKGLTSVASQIIAFEGIKLAPQSIERMLPEVRNINNQELLVVPGENALRAIKNAGFDIAVEVASERLGGPVAVIGRWGVGKTIGKLVKVPKLSLTTRKFLNRVGYQGPIIELGEEEAGRFVRDQATQFGLVDLAQEPFTAEDRVAMLLAFSVPGASAAVADFRTGRIVRRVEQAMEEVEKAAIEQAPVGPKQAESGAPTPSTESAPVPGAQAQSPAADVSRETESGDAAKAETQARADALIADRLAERKVQAEEGRQKTLTSAGDAVKTAQGAVRLHEQQKGYNRGKKGLEGVKKADVKYQALLKAERDAGRRLSGLEGARTRREKAAEPRTREDFIATVTLEKLPAPVAETIQAEAESQLGAVGFSGGKKIRSVKAREALLKIVRDKGADTGSEVQKQKRRLLGHLKGETDFRTVKERDIGVPERDPDPIIEAYLNGASEQAIQEIADDLGFSDTTDEEQFFPFGANDPANAGDVAERAAKLRSLGRSPEAALRIAKEEAEAESESVESAAKTDESVDQTPRTPTEQPTADEVIADEVEAGRLEKSNLNDSEDPRSPEGLGIVPRGVARLLEPPGEPVDRSYLPDGVRSRIDKSEGIKKLPLSTRLATWVQRQAVKMVRSNLFLPERDESLESARQFFRLVKEATKRGAEDGIAHVSQPLTPLAKEDLPLFRDYVAIRNELHNLETRNTVHEGWVEPGEEPDKVRIKERIEGSLLKMRAEIEKRGLVPAFEKRAELNAELTDRLVVAKLINRDALADPEDYFHQQVIMYAEADLLSSVTVASDPSGRKFKPAFAMARHSADKVELLPPEFNYNTSYIEAEARWVTDAYIKLRIVDAFDRFIRRRYDQYGDLKRRAARITFETAVEKFNERLGGSVSGLSGAELVAEIYELRGELAELRGELEQAEAGDRREIRERMSILGERLTEIDPTRPFDSSIARGLALVGVAASDAEVADLAGDAESFGDSEAGNIDFGLLNSLARADVEIPADVPFGELSPTAKGKIGALMVFKGLNGKAQVIQKLAGETKEGVTTFSDIKPAGFTEWYPQPGNIIFRATTIPERIAERIMREEFDANKIDKEDLRRVMAIGVPRAPMIIPEAVANQLDEMQSRKNVLGRADAVYMGYWKSYMLLAPHKTIGYQFRNITGDADPVIAGAVPAWREVPQATRETWNYYQGEIAMTPTLRAARDLAVLDSSMSGEELPDQQNHAILRRFLSKPQPLHGMPVRAVQEYFRVAQKYTKFRESILRYSAFLAYRKQLARELTTPGSLKHFGNSRRANVLTLLREHGADVAAAKMSRDLLGDYGNITIFGQWMRAYAMPFWSWQEINLHRVPRLALNSLRSGDSKSKALIPVTAMRLIATSRLAWMYAAFWSWNNLLNRHKERELTFYDRANPHILVCRNDDGSIRTFRNVGMLGDALEWFGLNTFFARLPDLESNSLTWGELAEEMGKDPLNKVFGSLRPDFKAALEGSTGLSFFPDVTNPRKIDRGRLVANNLGLGDLYGEARGALQRNGMRARPHARQRILVGVTDPKRSALNEMYALRSRFLRRMGREQGTFPRSAFAIVRQTLMNGDFEAYKEATLEFAKLKIAQGQNFAQSYKASLARLDPIDAALNKTLETEFEQNFLSSTERDRLRVARDYAQDLRVLGFQWIKKYKTELKQRLRE